MFAGYTEREGPVGAMLESRPPGMVRKRTTAPAMESQYPSRKALTPSATLPVRHHKPYHQNRRADDYHEYVGAESERRREPYGSL